MMKCKWSMDGQIVGSLLLLSECRYVQWRGPQQPFGARAPIFLDYHLYTPCRCPARPGHDKQKFMLACTFIASLVKPLVAATAVHREREQQHHHQTTSPPHQHHLLLLLRRRTGPTEHQLRSSFCSSCRCSRVFLFRLTMTTRHLHTAVSVIVAACHLQLIHIHNLISSIYIVIVWAFLMYKHIPLQFINSFILSAL